MREKALRCINAYSKRKPRVSHCEVVLPYRVLKPKGPLRSRSLLVALRFQLERQTDRHTHTQSGSLWSGILKFIKTKSKWPALVRVRCDRRDRLNTLAEVRTPGFLLLLPGISRVLCGIQRWAGGSATCRPPPPSTRFKSNGKGLRPRAQPQPRGGRPGGREGGARRTQALTSPSRKSPPWQGQQVARREMEQRSAKV